MVSCSPALRRKSAALWRLAWAARRPSVTVALLIDTLRLHPKTIFDDLALIRAAQPRLIGSTHALTALVVTALRTRALLCMNVRRRRDDGDRGAQHDAGCVHEGGKYRLALFHEADSPQYGARWRFTELSIPYVQNASNRPGLFDRSRRVVQPISRATAEYICVLAGSCAASLLTFLQERCVRSSRASARHGT